jgi:predicted membrane-bound spermidine synthase
MSLDESDIKALRRTSSTGFRLACTIGMSLVITLFLMATVVNMWLCHRLAARAGVTVIEVFSKWIAGISASEAYLGILLLAIQRLQMALTSLAVVGILGLTLWGLLSTASRNARILKFLEEN